MLASFDWPSIDEPGKIVIGIGGGHGQVSQYLARRTNHVHFVVQDLPHVVPTAQTQLPKDFMSRIDFVVHDFFTPQTMDPPPAVFLLRYVLHN